jgi:hypothetical protein
LNKSQSGLQLAAESVGFRSVVAQFNREVAVPKQSRSAMAKNSVHTILPETETLISIQTTPGAVCSLSHPQIKGQSLQLDADDDGIVRFHAKAAAGAKPIELHLESKGGGGSKIRHTIELRSGPRAPGAETIKAAATPARKKGKVRPALQGDPLALPNRELVKKGYPPRPNPVKNPARYARWLRIVSEPFTIVSDRTVPHPGVSFGHPQPRAVLQSPTLPLPPPMLGTMFNSNSSIWSGAYLTNPSAQFFWIEAEWYVPRVFAASGGPVYSAASEWIGLDNGGSDLFQSGSDSECWNLPGIFGGWTFTNYWMWIESLPSAASGVPNFAISPGDHVSVDIFVADQDGTTWFANGENGGLTPADNSVWFMLANYTQNESFWGTLPTAPGYTGTTAEFIVERPTVNGNVVPLALFAVTTMFNCWYGDSEYGDRSWRLGLNGSSPFDANLTYINMQNSADGNLLAFPISVPDPNSPGGAEIIWLWTNSS